MNRDVSPRTSCAWVCSEVWLSEPLGAVAPGGQPLGAAAPGGVHSCGRMCNAAEHTCVLSVLQRGRDCQMHTTGSWPLLGRVFLPRLQDSEQVCAAHYNVGNTPMDRAVKFYLKFYR